MDALDLTQKPPRSTRAKLADLDVLMLARTVDKLRATLPGGKLGVYKIAGFSERLLEALGIAEENLRDVVAKAASDGEVAAWVRERTDPASYPAISAKLSERIIGTAMEKDPTFVERYPVCARLAPETSMLDMLDEDDREMFPAVSADPSRA